MSVPVPEPSPAPDPAPTSEQVPSPEPAPEPAPAPASATGTTEPPVGAPEPLAAEPPAPELPAVGLPAVAESSAGTAPRRISRTVGVALSVAGLLAVTAASAAVTVAVGRPDPARHVAAAAAPSASAGASPSASPSPSPSPTPTPAPSPSVAPRPVSTLQGSVSGGKHSGDLRYFLLPVPDSADPYGSPDGSMMSVEELQAQYGKDVDIKEVLDSWGFKDAATRTYRTRDGKSEVRVELKRFGRTDRAQGFADHSGYDQDPFDVDGVPGAKGYIFKPEQQAYTGELYGIGVSGDVVYEVYVEVQGDPDKALLADAMKRARDRLANG